ncbi:MAG: hypothetical protein IKO00_03540 [Oscillospiraceae bacterium]|nr:hypothetical protein [Oscillospiraceae bacterium]
MDENFASTRSMIHFDWDLTPELAPPARKKTKGAHAVNKDTFLRKYGILLILAAAFTIYTILLSSWVNYRANKGAQEATQSAVRSAVTTAENHIFDVWGITREEFQEKEKAKAEGKTTPPTDAESFNQYVDREAIAVARVISKLSTEQQKYTEACCMLARVMSPDYPNDFESVAKQPQQWMFYDGTDNSYSERDKEIAESIVRPWLVNQTYPSGLTKEMVHGNWSPNDYVLRDSYNTTPTMHTWRYPG